MHEKILQGVTVGVVAGLIVYWFTSKHSADYAGKNSNPGNYRPLLGDVRTTRGMGTSADCQCCGLIAPENTTVPLAADYLCGAPQHAPATSRWNLGVSLQLSCEGIDLHSCVARKETGTSFPYGARGPKTVAKPIRIAGTLCCSPCVPISVPCTEVI